MYDFHEQKTKTVRVLIVYVYPLLKSIHTNISITGSCKSIPIYVDNIIPMKKPRPPPHTMSLVIKYLDHKKAVCSLVCCVGRGCSSPWWHQCQLNMCDEARNKSPASLWVEGVVIWKSNRFRYAVIKPNRCRPPRLIDLPTPWRVWKNHHLDTLQLWSYLNKLFAHVLIGNIYSWTDSFIILFE